MRVGGTVSNTLNGGGKETKILKKGASWVKG